MRNAHACDERQLFVIDKGFDFEVVKDEVQAGHLTEITDLVACKCPECGKDAHRETDTLSEQFESSWHHLELASAAGKDADLDAVAAQAAAIDFYCCGIEHANNHLQSARIMHRLLAKLGSDSDSDQSEPFTSLLCTGLTYNYGLPMTKAYSERHRADSGSSMTAAPTSSGCILPLAPIRASRCTGMRPS